MAVRRRRPLVPPPYPRRNRYTPSSIQTAPHSLPAYAESSRRSVAPPRRFTNASLVCEWILSVRLELGSLSRIVTHFAVEMCYDFVTFCFFKFLPA